MSTVMEYETITDQPAPDLHQHPIVFFDGVCGLCNMTVKRLLKMDRKGRLRFAPLQGETARRLLDQRDIEQLRTLVLVDERGSARYSTAVARILGHVGGIWTAASYALWLIPKPLRDLGYRMVSSNRYRLFGKSEACQLPQPGERERFLP